MPQLTRKKRVTENVSASRVAEADDVWHSTAIEDISITAGRRAFHDISGSLEPQTSPKRRDIRKQANQVPVPVAGPSSRAVGSSNSNRRNNNVEHVRSPSPSPIVINPPSGHSFFSGVLQKCGYIIRQPNSSNEMFYDLMIFRKKLSDWLTENDDKLKRIETETAKFFNALNIYLSDKDNLTSSMKPTRHETELIQPSLLHCLLGIEALQQPVLQIIMPLLGEASFSTGEQDVALVGTLLNQLKWLPVIVEGQKFVDNIIPMLDSAAFTNQCQIMRLLPDIIPSHLHQQVALKLLDKFGDEEASLNIALMDCFSSLDIPEDGFWTSIRNTAVDQMATASLQDIPAYFAFLFRTENQDALAEVITTVREKVRLIPDRKSAKNDAHQVEILEKVSFCITVNPSIVTIWIKQVKEDLTHAHAISSITCIDLIMLLVFADSHKSVVPTLKQLFAEKQLAVRLFDGLLESHTPMLDQLFPTVSRLVDNILRGKDAKCLGTVCDITVKLFSSVGAFKAQELIGNLSSLLINFPSARDTILLILTKLAQQEALKLLRFASYLMGMLEYVMNFPAKQIKSLMNILAILSQTEGTNSEWSNHFSAEFSILLRKQLTNSDLKIRCFGVFGALASIKQISERTVPDDARVKELLRLAWNFVERDEDACSIFFDELADCVHSIPDDICKTFRDIMKSKFQRLWTIDQASHDQLKQYGERVSLSLVPDFDANKECSQERLAVIFENQPLEMSPHVIPAHLRVLAELESKTEAGDLEGIDAIIGCPVLFPRMEDYYLKESIADLTYNQRFHLGNYIILAINFFRESVNAFIGCGDPELQIKVWVRINNILKLQGRLVRHFESFPSLPVAYVEEKTLSNWKNGGMGPSNLFKHPKDSKAKAGPSVGKKDTESKSKRKKARVEVFSDSDSDGEGRNKSVITKKPTTKEVRIENIEEEIQPKMILPYLRRFDATVFQLLHFPLSCKESEMANFSRILGNLSVASQNPNTMERVAKFSPDTLALLLTELIHQVSHDDRKRLDILSVKKLLKFICSHINTIKANCGDTEDEDLDNKMKMKLEHCLRLLMTVMMTYFEAMNKLDNEAKEVGINKSIATLAKQAPATDVEEGSSQAEIMANVSTYLASLVFVIKDSTTALVHMKLLKVLHDLLHGFDNPFAQVKKAIHECSVAYLKRDWKLSSQQVDGFLKIWLVTTKSPVNIIKHLTENVVPRDDDDSFTHLYESCTATNFHVWYSNMLSSLSQYVYKHLRRSKPDNFEDLIEEWTQVIDVFKDLVAVTKTNCKAVLLVSLLKNCRFFLEAFISGGAELLPEYWKKDKAGAQKFCKALQLPCRTIQYICEHSKKITDLQLLKSVPVVKRSLETLVFRVREVLAVHGAANAFWMGSLKHRDLKGVCMTSQIISENEELDMSSSDEEIGEALLSGERITCHPDIIEDESMDIDASDSE